MYIEIRKARSEDITAVCKIVNQLTPGQPHDYRNAVEKFTTHIRLSDDYYLWVAELDGKIVGTAMMHLQHKLSYQCGTAAHVEDLIVDKKHKGMGIGDMLVKKAIETAKKHSCYKIMLTCYPKTASYYERFKFVKHDIGMKRVLINELYT